MAARDTGAEQLIKDTARRIFFVEGRLSATTQEIADAAGVTRTLLNYYFRSKDVLLDQVFNEGVEDMVKRVNEVLQSSLPFRKKIENFINLFSAEIAEYPYREVFMISKINSHEHTLPHKKDSTVMREFIKEIQLAMDNGIIKKMKPANFMINLFSLIAYPVATRPLFRHILEVNDAQYLKLLAERKKMIMDILFI